MPPSPAPNTCIAFLLRHGATDNNLADPPRLQGRAVDVGLSVQGHEQAEQAATLLASQDLSAVYSSPLKRAFETAQHVAKRHGHEVQCVPEIEEVDVGRWEGRSWVEIAQTEPQDHQRFLEDAAIHGYPEGENMNQVLARILPALEKVFAANLGKQIAVVGHNVVNRVFLSHLLGMPLSKARRVSHDNCGVSVVRYRDQEGMRLLTMNSTFHLNGEG